MKECSLETLFLEHDYPEDFFGVICQKRTKPSRSMICIRVFFTLYSYAVMIWLICELFLASKLKLYISYCFWVQVLWSITAEFALMKSTKIFRKYDPDDLGSGLPWFVKTYWALFSATLPAMVVSFTVFWSQTYEENVDIVYIFMSNVTPFMSLLEFTLIAFPLRIINFFYFLLHSLLYIIFSVIYQTAGGRGIHGTPWIYKDLDWNNPKHAVLACFIALLVGEAAYVIFWGLSVLKLSKWCCRRDSDN